MRNPYLLLVLAPALVFLGCGQKENKAKLAPDDRLPRLETVQPTRSLLPVRIELSATVEPLERADLCARVPGTVDHLPADVDIGRRITKGEELIHLAVPELDAMLEHKKALLEQAKRQKVQAEEACVVSSKEYAETEKQLKRYVAELTLKKLEHERVTELVRRNATQPERVQETQRSLEVAQATFDAARAGLETRQAKIKAADADLQVADSKIRVAEAEVTNLTAQVSYATIKAPFDGVITKRWVDRGATIKDAGAALLTVMHTDTVRVLVDIPERHVPLVNAREQKPNENGQGDQVTLRIPALHEAEDEGEFTGTICRIASALDPATRTMRAEVHIPNPKGQLRPGMQGTAVVLLDERYDVLTVPSTALVRGRNNRVEVFIVVDPSGDPPRGMTRRVPVELGLDDGRRVQIRKGLKGTERVVAKGNGVVREGEVVIAVPLREP